MVTFAAAYSRRLLAGEDSDAFLEVGGLKDRWLVVDDRFRIVSSGRRIGTTDKPFKASWEIAVGSAPQDLLREARNQAAGLFGMFGLVLNDAVLEDWQGKMRSY